MINRESGSGLLKYYNFLWRANYRWELKRTLKINDGIKGNDVLRVFITLLEKKEVGQNEIGHFSTVYPTKNC